MIIISEYDMQANNFLVKANTTMEMVFDRVVDGFPFANGDHYPHNAYRVKLRRNGKTYTFDFFDSFANYENNKKPTKYDALACLEKYEVDPNMWEFAKEYGYTINDEETYKEVEKIHKACLKQYRKLLALFGDELMQELQEIY